MLLLKIFEKLYSFIIYVTKLLKQTLGPYRFMTNKNFMKEGKIKVEFSELSQMAFTKMKQF